MFYVVNLDVTQSRQANDSASIVKRAKERFRNSETLQKAQQKAKCHDYRKSLSLFNKLLSAYNRALGLDMSSLQQIKDEGATCCGED